MNGDVWGWLTRNQNSLKFMYLNMCKSFVPSLDMQRTVIGVQSTDSKQLGGVKQKITQLCARHITSGQYGNVWS